LPTSHPKTSNLESPEIMSVRSGPWLKSITSATDMANKWQIIRRQWAVYYARLLHSVFKGNIREPAVLTTVYWSSFAASLCD